MTNAQPGQREHLLSHTPDSLIERLTGLGMARYRAQQVLQWVYRKRVTDFQKMTNIGVAERATLAETFDVLTAELVRSHAAPDATEKILLRWPGGGLTETVMIPRDDDHADDYGKVTVQQRRTACLSTQVGCPVGCRFCASGLEGWQGNLTVGQVVEEALRLTLQLPEDERLSNIVFMGMGEPLANFDTTVAAVRTLMAPWGLGISGRKITVSTVGLPPQMKRLADLKLPVTLAISLHAPNDALREQIIPWAEKIRIEQLVDAGRYYFEQTGREVTLEYIMLDGLNTLPEHARELATVARKLRANVNLIYYNEVPDLPFKRPEGPTMFAFQNVLRERGVNVHVRRSRGREIAAACGQLARVELSVGGSAARDSSAANA